MKKAVTKENLEAVLDKVRDYVKGGDYILEIIKTKKGRSLPQNSYFHAVIVVLISERTGYTKDEAKYLLKSFFLSYEKANAKTGEIETFIRDTSDLSTIEFEKFCEDCRLWAWHELDIHIPVPNEVTDEFLIQLANVYSY